MSALDAASQARVYLDTNRPAQAITALGQALADQPDAPELLQLLAQAHLAADSGRQGATDAIAAATKALALDPDDPFPWRILSIAYTRLGSHAQSREAARTSRQLAPWLWVSHTIVAHADASAHAISTDTANSMAEALRLAPGEAEVHFAAGRVADASRDTGAAADHYREALSLDPTHAGARNNLAVIDMRNGNAGSAAAGFVGILARDPNSALALYNLRVAAGRSLRVVNIVLWVAVVIVNGVGRGPATGTTDKTISVIVALLATACILGYVLWVRRRAGAYFSRFVRSIPKTDRVLTVWASALACCLVAIVAAIFVPATAVREIYSTAAIVLFISLVGSTVLRRTRP
ncbi:MAG TPA: tetratricopeptide repeat protein [Galbitalea sp.]